MRGITPIKHAGSYQKGRQEVQLMQGVMTNMIQTSSWSLTNIRYFFSSTFLNRAYLHMSKGGATRIFSLTPMPRHESNPRQKSCTRLGPFGRSTDWATTPRQHSILKNGYLHGWRSLLHTSYGLKARDWKLARTKKAIAQPSPSLKGQRSFKPELMAP